MKEQNLRVTISKRMLKEGLFRCLKKKPLEKITVSELCREAQVNRTTFYNHYVIPRDILLEIGIDHAKKVREIFLADSNKTIGEKRKKVLIYIYSVRDELKILFSAEADAHVENTARDFFTWFVDGFIEERKNLLIKDEAEHEMIRNCMGWSSYFLVRQWLTQYEEKTPEEMHDFFERLSSGL
ncbi:MAG: TetR/AcrR family transcriptional regulator [Oscillospiraceae bacterium]|nr:TetR/AcrR family transcriptional regulator [Clostridiales bacterium]MBR6923634.1 TetR/AcrR family transcriptional regulator [Oscillospiraceae bacterium]